MSGRNGSAVGWTLACSVRVTVRLAASAANCACCIASRPNRQFALKNIRRPSAVWNRGRTKHARDAFSAFEQIIGRRAGKFPLSPAEGADEELERLVRFLEVVDVSVFEERQGEQEDDEADGHLDRQAQEEDVYLRRDAVDDAEEEVC